MKKLRLFLGCAASVATMSLIAGCGQNPESEEGGNNKGNWTFKTQPASGLIDGQPFVFRGGKAKVSFSDSSKYWVDLWDKESNDPCNAFGTDYMVLMSLPKQTGSYTLDYQRNFTLNHGARNTVVTQGQIVVTSVTSNSISGKLVGSFDGNNYLNGEFTVPICP